MSITITEIAEMTGVSKSTVHRALSGSAKIRGDIRKLVLECAARHHYQPNLSARVLVGARTYLAAILAKDFGNIHFAQFLRGAGEAASGAGYHLLTASSEKELVNLKQLGLEGVIGFFQEDLEAEFDGLPTVNLVKALPPEGRKDSCLNSEVACGTLQVMRYLIGLGHRRIGHVTLSIPRDRDVKTKLSEYRHALKEAGIAYDPSLVVRSELYMEQCGYEGAMTLLTRPDPPTAIFALSDILAAGCYRAARELKLRVPRDISICGYDDKEYSSLLYPSLTTVRTPYKLLGERAMKMLIARIGGEPGMDEEPLLPVLIPRGSTTRPRKISTNKLSEKKIQENT